ncbi:hypothetical protein [Capnocytophaga sp. H2931]|uniref:hypothetical protein n=1 Tax=Capnocytophaga sp. H2931 TaxID=1945657 RepID=UPI000BB1E40B|nr:hypothetical protein [Capnocytophaga sp. H2931]ATA75400.1 hypothetical protein CGC52_08225 [Capnocytophaga sp. H2931]
MTKIFTLFIVILLFSCQENPKNKIEEELLKWRGKEIIFPDSMIFTKFTGDTVPCKYQDYKHKMLIYVDSTGCTPCKLKLGAWELLIKELNALPNGSNLSYIFYFADKKRNEIDIILRNEGFDLPVVVDEENKLDKLNNFSDNENFHYFLLDEKNRVKIVGNPIYNTKVKELYFSEIQKE